MVGVCQCDAGRGGTHCETGVTAVLNSSVANV